MPHAVVAGEAARVTLLATLHRAECYEPLGFSPMKAKDGLHELGYGYLDGKKLSSDREQQTMPVSRNAALVITGYTATARRNGLGFYKYAGAAKTLARPRSVARILNQPRNHATSSSSYSPLPTRRIPPPSPRTMRASSALVVLAVLLTPHVAAEPLHHSAVCITYAGHDKVYHASATQQACKAYQSQDEPRCDDCSMVRFPPSRAQGSG